MSNMTDYPENLVVRARRAALLPGEQAELEQLLAASPTLRTAYRLGRDFDEIAAVEAGDEQRVEHFVDRALAMRRPRRSHWFVLGRGSPWLAAAAVLAVCGVAFGVRGVWWPLRTPSAAAPVVQPASAPARRKPKAAPVPRVTTQPLSEPSAATTQSDPSIAADQDVTEPKSLLPSPANREAPVSATRAPAARTAASVASPTTTLPVNTSAAERKGPRATFSLETPSESDPGALLRKASRARSLGEIDRAIALLTELQNEFPNSAQARVSLVSLGKLLMQRGMPEAALQRFSTYLTVPGPLEEEALFGRAQALGALGRAGDEIRTWERLLSRFPGSLYAGAARKRLVALGGVSDQ